MYCALVYKRQVLPAPLDMPQACVATTKQPSDSDKSASAPPLDFLVKILNYPKARASLLELLSQSRDVIALSGESMDSTDKQHPYLG